MEKISEMKGKPAAGRGFWPRRPSNWPRVKLGDLGTITRGNGIKRSETRERGCPCLRYGEIYTSYNFVLDRPRSFVSKEVFDSSLHIKKNDLVFTLTGETEDEIAKTLAYLGDEEIAAGGDLAVWKNHGCDPKFLAYLMYSPELIKAKALASNGQIIVHISVKKFQEIEIPLPPLAVQREIVARLEKELAAVERMAKGFEAMKAEADQLFKSTLKETFEEVSRGGAETRRLGDVCETVSSRGHQIKQSEIKDFGRYIVISQSENEIEGYTDFDSPIEEVPLILFGDHTCIVKKIDKPFVVGADGTKLLKSSMFDSSYLYYVLKDISVTLLDGEYRRHYSDLVEREISIITLPTQREIVAKLDAVRARCEKLKRAAEEGVQTAALMRKAILKEAFA